MADRRTLLEMVRSGASYQEIGHRVGMPAGLVYMIVTGLPADGGDVPGPEGAAGREGVLAGSSQHLANPPTEVPTRDEQVAAWMRARARGDRHMQQAAAARSPEPPPVVHADQVPGAAPSPAAEDPGYPTEATTTTADTGDDDVLTVLVRDHNQITHLQQELTAEQDPDRRARIAGLIGERVRAHEAVEERHLWPAVVRALPDGAALAERGRGQEAEGARLLRELDGLAGTDDRFDGLAGELLTALRRHVAFEDRVFLALRSAMPREAREELGRRILRDRAGTT